MKMYIIVIALICNISIILTLIRQAIFNVLSIDSQGQAYGEKHSTHNTHFCIYNTFYVNILFQNVNHTI